VSSLSYSQKGRVFFVGAFTKRIAEPLELLRVRLIVGCMGPSRHGPSLSHSHTAASATRQKTDFHLSQKEKVHFLSSLGRGAEGTGPVVAREMFRS
jgi:hypothetical protein